MKYKVTVTETLLRVVNVDSSSAEEAEYEVRCLYRKAIIVLDWSDFTEYSIKALPDNNPPSIL